MALNSITLSTCNIDIDKSYTLHPMSPFNEFYWTGLQFKSSFYNNSFAQSKNLWKFGNCIGTVFSLCEIWANFWHCKALIFLDTLLFFIEFLDMNVSLRWCYQLCSWRWFYWKSLSSSISTPKCQIIQILKTFLDIIALWSSYIYFIHILYKNSITRL
jgi:hypothetical protein